MRLDDLGEQNDSMKNKKTCFKPNQRQDNRLWLGSVEKRNIWLWGLMNGGVERENYASRRPRVLPSLHLIAKKEGIGTWELSACIIRFVCDVVCLHMERRVF